MFNHTILSFIISGILFFSSRNNIFAALSAGVSVLVIHVENGVKTSPWEKLEFLRCLNRTFDFSNPSTVFSARCSSDWTGGCNAIHDKVDGVDVCGQDPKCSSDLNQMLEVAWDFYKRIRSNTTSLITFVLTSSSLTKVDLSANATNFREKPNMLFIIYMSNDLNSPNSSNFDTATGYPRRVLEFSTCDLGFRDLIRKEICKSDTSDPCQCKNEPEILNKYAACPDEMEKFSSCSCPKGQRTTEVIPEDYDEFTTTEATTAEEILSTGAIVGVVIVAMLAVVIVVMVVILLVMKFRKKRAGQPEATVASKMSPTTVVKCQPEKANLKKSPNKNASKYLKKKTKKA